MIHPKQAKIIGFSAFLFSTFWVSRKNKFMLSCVRVQVHFMKNVSLKLKNRTRVSGFFHRFCFIEKHHFFLQTGESTRNRFLRTALQTD
jgi:hypothetical protein